MYDRVKAILRQAGMNESEASMFRALLEACEAVPLKEAIVACKMTEFTGYRTARRLCEKGFVEIEKRGRLRFVRALPLSRIAGKVGSEARKLRRLELKVLDIETGFNTVNQRDHLTASGNATLQTLEGREQFIDTYASIPEYGGEYLLAFGSIGNLWNVTEQDYFSNFEADFIRRRVRAGIRAFLVDSEGSCFQMLMERAKKELRDVRILNLEIEPNQYTIITEKKVFVFDTNIVSPRVIVVHDARLVRMIRGYHESLWSKAVR